MSNRDKFIHGITNIASASETQTFLYFNICPKLQVHGLVENEKVTGVRYRRYAITKAGAAFLAEYDRRVFEMNEKKKLNGANDSITKTAETSTTTQEPTAPKNKKTESKQNL
nr:hypothetical protein [Pseudomonas sp. BIGb0427]